jgi:hypothetical protein
MASYVVSSLTFCPIPLGNSHVDGFVTRDNLKFESRDGTVLGLELCSHSDRLTFQRQSIALPFQSNASFLIKRGRCQFFL